MIEREFSHYQNAVEQVIERININGDAQDYLTSLGEVRPELGMLFAAHVCQLEVCDGGFEQFFFGNAGVVAPEAAEGFAAIGQESVALLVKSAMKKFGEPYPRERLDRVAILDDMDEETAQALMEIEEHFQDLIDQENGGFEAAADRYAKALPGQ